MLYIAAPAKMPEALDNMLAMGANVSDITHSRGKAV
jgi:hypothetical protein